jgi:putative DNA primase/helicase
VAALATLAGAATVAIVVVPAEWPEGWDIADPLPDGVAADALAELLRSAIPGTPAAAPNEPCGEVDATAETMRLARLPLIQYGRERKAVAQRLGCPVAFLDKAVAAERGDGNTVVGQGRPLDLPEPELWPHPVDGAALLEETVTAIRQYVVFTEAQGLATALWAIFTHAFDAFDFSPRLAITSAEKRSGKTRLVEVLERIVDKPLFVSGITAAALLRVIEQRAPCMLLDEIDTMMKGDAELRQALRGLINSGFDRAGARFVKNVPTPGGGYEAQAFSTWCPMVLAGIGKLPDTVADRSIPIGLERKTSAQKVKPLRAGGGDELRDIGRKAARWVADNLDALRDARPETPAQLHDRAADTWSPLFAIADVAGGIWPERARAAAIELSGDGEETMSDGVLLLADLCERFAEEPSGVLFTREILAALNADETRPWPEYKHGKPLTERQLAALLKPFKVKPRPVRRGSETGKGYRLEWLNRPFTAYLPPRSVPASHSSDPAGFDADRSVTPAPGATGVVTHARSKKPCVSAVCDAVTDHEALADDYKFQERAGIIEYDGEYPRAEAEQRAWAELTGRRDKSFLQ